MSKTIIPKNYDPKYGIMETEIAIKAAKDCFERELAKALDLTRISAPMFVRKSVGINDNLNGVERPVAFEMKEMPDVPLEIVHSLAKWKRIALKQYGVEEGKGIYTDMNAIRRDEDLDNMHSIYVDQWDWEKVIPDGHRNIAYLKETVETIYKVIRLTELAVEARYDIEAILPKKITFIHSEELVEKYPDLTPKEREDAITKEYGAVFLIGIGGILPDGKPHDGRAPDYDDWTTESENGYHGLNGDILVWNEQLGHAFELSSMGIRVDEDALKRQVEITGDQDRLKLDWHQALLHGLFPLTIGGGIGQSRMAMFLLRKKHIGEVQTSVWPDAVRESYENIL